MADELSGKERRRELYTEAIRDVGILVLVFAPLDILTSKGDWHSFLVLGRVLGLMGVAVAVIVFGVRQDPRGRRR